MTPVVKRFFFPSRPQFLEARMERVESMTSRCDGFVTTRFTESDKGVTAEMPRLRWTRPPEDDAVRLRALQTLAGEFDVHFHSSEFTHGDLNRKNIRWVDGRYVVFDFEPWLIDEETGCIRSTFPYIDSHDLQKGWPTLATDLIGWHFFIRSQLDRPFKRPRSVEEANQSQVKRCCGGGTFRSVLSRTVGLIPSAEGNGTFLRDC